MSNFRTWFNEQSEEAQELFLGKYPRLLLEGNKYTELCQLLSNYYFIEAKINHPLFGVQELIEDYDLLDNSEIRNNSEYAETVKALKLIQRALFSLTHIIFKDPKQLKGQLSARLTYFDLPEIKNLLAQIATDKNIGLYSLIGSLTPPGGGGLIHTLKGHSGWVNAIALTPDGKTVISGSSDNTIKIWDLVTGTEKLTFKGHSHSINAIALTPDGKTVISGSSDNTIKIWDLVTGTENLTFKGHSHSINAIALTPDGKTVISGSSDNTIKIWDLVTGTENLTFKGHSHSINAIALTPDGKTVISGSSDNTIKIWDLVTGQEKLTFKGHSSWVTAIALTPDGQTMISGSDDKTIKIWDLPTGQEKFTFKGHSCEVRAIALTPDGQTMISGSYDKTIKIWDLPTGQEKFTFKGHSYGVRAIALTPDGQTVISGSYDKTIKIWDLVTETENFTFISPFKGHSHSVNAITLTPDGKTVISGSYDKTIKIWDLVTGTEKLTFQGHTWVRAIALTPDGKTVISGSYDNTIKIWDLVTGTEKLTFKGHSHSINAIALTPDGKTVISGSSDNTIKIWDLATGQEKFKFIFKGHSSWIRAISLTPDGKTVISGSDDKTIKIWDVGTGQEKFTLPGHSYSVSAIAVTPDGKTVISGSDDKTIKIWDVGTGRKKFTLQGHSDWVRAISLTPDGKTVISGSADNTIKIWDLATRKEIATFTGENPITSCAVAPDGVTIVAAELSGRLHLLRLQQMNSLSFSASAKSENFVGRDFIFTAINKFLHRYPKGYFTIVGVPGSGKSAILAQFVRQNPHTIYYNAQIAGKNRVEAFFPEVCTQLNLLLEKLSSTPPQPSPQTMTEIGFINAHEGSWLFSTLLQQVSENLPDQKIIIVIDGLDGIDINSQAVGTNLFYLPRYLPDQIYFIFARRPYQKSHSGLLIEAPSQILDLADYPVENRQDIKAYIRKKRTAETQSSQRNIIELINENEDNFMYVQQVLKAMADGFYSVNNFEQIPPYLETYYQQHWQKMQGHGLSDVAMDILRVLTAEETQPMSTVAISKIIKADVFDVAEIMETWLEFLQEIHTNKETKYQLYHHSFRLYLHDYSTLPNG